MARIQTRKGKKRTTYTATVRMKGFPVFARTFDTKGEAKIWAADVEKEMRAGRFQDTRPAEKITLAEAIERYLEHVSSQKRPNSDHRDRIAAKAILEKFGQEISLTDVSSQRLANYRDSRIKQVTPSTIQKEFALLSHLFNVARREWGLPISNPVSDISKPKIKNERTRFLTFEEAQKLLDTAMTSRNKKLYHYLLLLMHTGMRPSEAAGLTWGNIDLDARIVKLYVTKTDMRSVPLTQKATETLQSIRPEDALGSTLVFLPNDSNLTMLLKNRPNLYFRKAYDTVRKKVGLEDVHLHDLRHTAASHLLMAGADLRTLAEILGHKTLQMVLRYTHLLNDHKLNAVDRINSLGVNNHPPSETQD